jgi:hypothetical protein
MRGRRIPAAPLSRALGVPFVGEHDRHVGVHARAFGMFGDTGNESIRIGENIGAAGEHRALGPVRIIVRRLDDPPQCGVEHQAREQDQSRVAVGFEDGEAVVGIGDVEPNDLPGQMRRKC